MPGVKVLDLSDDRCISALDVGIVGGVLLGASEHGATGLASGDGTRNGEQET